MMSRQLYSRTRDAKSLFPSSSSLDTNNNNNNRGLLLFFVSSRDASPLSFKKLLWGQDSWGVEGILKRKRRLGFRVFRDEEKV